MISIFAIYEGCFYSTYLSGNFSACLRNACGKIVFAQQSLRNAYGFLRLHLFMSSFQAYGKLTGNSFLRSCPYGMLTDFFMKRYIDILQIIIHFETKGLIWRSLRRSRFDLIFEKCSETCGWLDAGTQTYPVCGNTNIS